jgi:5-methylthioribose kinase
MSATFSTLSLDRPKDIKAHLQALGWLPATEKVTRMEIAGEGNMNLVVRVVTAERSFILKQSRPWVEKYPSIAAPGDRILSEVAFYQAVAGQSAVASRMPAILAVDEESRSAMLEDLGTASDCTDLYAGGRVDPQPLAAWLSGLHTVPVPDGLRGRLRNREMRTLNHAHIFDLPMSGAHGMDLDEVTPGLQRLAAEFRARAGLLDVVSGLGDLYLADGDALLHGDFYPGSWLRTEDGVKVIDPEFGFLGAPEFDLGVFAAHLHMSGYSEEEVSQALKTYAEPFDRDLVSRFAGVEIMRRLLGVAQLPMVRTLAEKEHLLMRAERLLRA